MYASPDRLGQLASDHHHEMIAAARRRQPRPERGTVRGRPAPRIPALTRRLAAAFARSTPAPAS